MFKSKNDEKRKRSDIPGDQHRVFGIPALLIMIGCGGLAALAAVCVVLTLFVTVGRTVSSRQNVVENVEVTAQVNSTPAASFGQGSTSGYPLITLERIGKIEKGTRVRVSQMLLGKDGWIYTIVGVEEANFEDARESQLAYAPGITPGAIAEAKFSKEIGMGGYRMITTEQVGPIAKGSRVNIGSARLGLDGWLYAITDESEHSADAQDSQLTYAPGVIPGATQTAKFGG